MYLPISTISVALPNRSDSSSIKAQVNHIYSKTWNIPPVLGYENGYCLAILQKDRPLPEDAELLFKDEMETGLSANHEICSYINLKDYENHEKSYLNWHEKRSTSTYLSFDQDVCIVIKQISSSTKWVLNSDNWWNPKEPTQTSDGKYFVQEAHLLKRLPAVFQSKGMFRHLICSGDEGVIVWPKYIPLPDDARCLTKGEFAKCCEEDPLLEPYMDACGLLEVKTMSSKDIPIITKHPPYKQHPENNPFPPSITIFSLVEKYQERPRCLPHTAIEEAIKPKNVNPQITANKNVPLLVCK